MDVNKINHGSICNMYKKFIYKLDRKKIERYVWISTEAVEEYICELNGWIPADGMHGTDAFTKDGRHIEIKTQAYTGNSKTTLNGMFTFSNPSLKITERVKNEEMHIFGRDDISYQIVYHISISGEEFVPHLIEHCNSGKKHAAKWNYNLYKDFKSFRVHSYDKKHIKKYPERWSSDFARMLMGDLKYYKHFYRKELKGYKLLNVIKGENYKTKLHVKSKKYGVETTRTLSELKKWKPKTIYIKNLMLFHIRNTINLDVKDSYQLFINNIRKEFNDPEIVTYRTYQKYVRNYTKQMEN